ncbi:MAG: PD-(D/E)XK nuclease family protein, partial [Halocynthiibacter sp.]
VWKARAEEQPEPMRLALQQLKSRQMEERDRQLYVAMTRAKSWLIIAAAGDLGTSGNSWHDVVRGGMEVCGAQPIDFAVGAGLRLQAGDWSAAPLEDEAKQAPPDPAVPEWAWKRAPAPARTPKVLSPSDLGGAKALPGDAGLDQDAAMLRGARIHLLLEHLPDAAPGLRDDLGRSLLSDGDAPMPQAEVASILSEAQGVLTAPGLHALFAGDALTEVDISAPLAALGGARIRGAIDRLLVTSDRVLAVDFKSNATVPGHARDVPEGLLRQMGAYHAALSQIYPEKVVQVAIVWTRTATLMELPQEIVIAALQRAATS